MKKYTLQSRFLSLSGIKTGHTGTMNMDGSPTRSIVSRGGYGKYCSIMAFLFFLPFLLKAQTTTISVGGTNRTIFVHAPSNLGQNRPLVISLHGLNQDINYQKGQAKWEQVADTAKFVVVYPAGINNSWDISGNRDTDF